MPLSRSFRQPLPQQASSKSLPFPAILFVPRLSWLIERGDGIPPRMFGIVLTVPYRNNHLPRCDVPTSGTKANTYYFRVCLGDSCNNMRRRGARCRIWHHCHSSTGYTVALRKHSAFNELTSLIIFRDIFRIIKLPQAHMVPQSLRSIRQHQIVLQNRGKFEPIIHRRV